MTTEQPAPVLDDLQLVQNLDRRNMLRLINELPEQCETALGIGRSFRMEPFATRPNVIYITGTGVSGLAADMAAAVLGESSDVPIVSNHDGRIPAFVGEGSLVLVVDYTGKSQSAIRCYNQAKQRGAIVVCMTGGGKLHEAVSKDSGLIVRLQPGQPTRAAIGYLLVPIIAVVEQCELASGVIEKLSFAIKLMKNIRESFRFDNPTARNIAKQTALALFEKTPVIFSTWGYRTLVADRWRSQFGANSKTPALCGAFPDLNEGSICAWEVPDRCPGNAAFVFLQDATDKIGDVRNLMSATKEVFSRFETIELEMKGATLVEQVLYGVYLGDYVSYYLALLNGVDPTATESVKLIEELIAGTA